jgi:HEAT repeat protein
MEFVQTILLVTLGIVALMLSTMVVLFAVRAALIAVRHAWLRSEGRRIERVLARHLPTGFQRFGALRDQLGAVSNPDLLDGAMRRVVGLEFEALPPDLRTRIVRIYTQYGLIELHRSRLLASRFWRERADSAMLLAWLDRVDAIPILAAALRDPYEDASTVKAAVGRALGLFRALGTAEALVVELAQLNEWSSPRIAEVLVELGATAVPALVEALGQQSLNLRIWSARILGAIGDPLAVEPLLLQLEDPRAEVRGAAIEALGQLADPRGVQVLGSVLLRDPTPQVRAAAARALGRVGHPDSLDPLLLALGDSDHWTRVRVIAAVEALGMDDASRLVEIARQANEIRARGAAACLVRLGFVDGWLDEFVTDVESSGREPLEELLGLVVARGETAAVVAELRRQSEFRLRCRLIRLLGRARDSDAQEAVAEATRDSWWPVRSDAVEAYARMKPADLGPVLERLQDSEPMVRVAALRALRHLGPEASVHADLSSQLSRLARSTSPAVRIGVLEYLQQVQEPPLGPTQILLTDPDKAVRSGAALLLGRVKAAAAVPALVQLLSDPTEVVRAAAADELGALGGSAAIRALVLAASSSAAGGREAITSALARQGYEAVVAYMDLFLSGGAAEGKIAAVWTLGKTSDPRAVPRLARFLRDPDPLVRRSAAGALSRCRHRSAIAVLQTALQDADGFVRASAVNAVSRIGLPIDVPLLLARLDDADPWVRRRAVVGIGRIGGAEAEQLLVTVIAQGDDSVVGAAVGLARMGSPAAMVALASWLSSPGRIEALSRALGEEEASEAAVIREHLAGLPPDLTVQALRRWAEGLQERLILSRDSGDRRRSLELLRGWLEGRPLTWLAPLVSSDADAGVRQRAVELIDSTWAGALTTLGGALKDIDPGVRLAAVRQLASVATESADLRADLGDQLVVCGVGDGPGQSGEDPRIERLARLALAHLFDFDAAGLGAVEHRAATLERRLLCVQALGAIRHRDRAAELLRLLLDEQPRVRRSAVLALGREGSPEAAGAIRAATLDEDPEVRAAAASALGQVEVGSRQPSSRSTEPGYVGGGGKR